ncbi:class I SAM-dependent methyltransferase [Maricaulis parjimensis]|uniref:class I SAM-dependent methyltransferase n=1 Tax=Maricaulis parjimensis TaxID=144023 RepID=UPI00193A2999|nr:50S ribosomal protein L11 methyltransferase [Maricaulis parjimensis]
MAPPLVPEVQLHLAVETVEIWERTEEALGEMGLPPPFWAFAWAGGQALARYCLDQPDILAGQRVLDFAAGGAVSGIAAKKAGAASVEACELDAFAIAAIQANAAANHVTLETRLGDLVGTDDGWDVVLAGDVFYEAEPARLIGGWLEQLNARGATVLIGDPGRSFLPQDKLEKMAEYTVPVTRDLEDREVRYAKVWRYK